MVMPESGLARLFVMESEAREGPRDGGSGARRNSGRGKKRTAHSSCFQTKQSASSGEFRFIRTE
jgi:hypothetical protein